MFCRNIPNLPICTSTNSAAIHESPLRFNYNTGEVRMSWNQPYPVILLQRIDLPDFKLVNFSMIAVEQMYPAGLWDGLTVSFVFQRRLHLNVIVPLYG
ncbi:hypothetical protein GCK72_013228 [Caenorhabditis remanei]|uniref:Uncharacterized protein n=1 Tax=Caenorhabditis remanei TaxID=31234 RepID=A0A6A5GQ72_CAERE|nr:hypothetical protein GCK72_013228 [Caenorhabditis remanei]KAF1756774.1 hypothetical protein GCK72_013228 [Caenorhabditis remanei]